MFYSSSQAQQQASPLPVDGEILRSQVEKRITNINTNELQQQLLDRPETVVIDVRNSDEIRQHGGMIESEHTLNISRGWLEYFAPQSIRDVSTPIVVYCGTDRRQPDFLN